MLVALLLASLVSQTPTEGEAAVAFMRTLQTPSGGFVTQLPTDGSEPVPSLRTTRTALRGLRLWGGEPADRNAVRGFLLACYDPKTGGFSDRPGLPPDPISTSVALMIMEELDVPLEKYLDRGLAFMNQTTENFEQIRMVAPGLEQLQRTVPNVPKWLKTIDAARHEDGSYGEGPGRARTTALYVVAQQRLGGKPESAEAVLKVLRAGQRPDGGFGSDEPDGSDLESCYRIVRLFDRLNAEPDDVPALRKFMESCRNVDGGFGRRPDERSSLHGTYYVAIVRSWLDAPAEEASSVE